MRTILLIAISLSFSTLSFAHSDNEVHPKLKFAQDSEDLASRVETGRLVLVQEDVSFPEGPQKKKFEQAMAIMEEVMNSEEFKTKVIGYVSSLGRKYRKNYLWSNSKQLLTNEDIYQIIMNGDEKMRPQTKGEMNINSWVKYCSGIKSFGTWCRAVIGSTTPSSSKWITLNWNFYSRFSTPDMVANMVHEWIHLLGFLHGNVRTDEEVPYVVENIAGEVAKNILSRSPKLY